jgi:3',5'-cyclic AMP phosphodiesterase CpdA
MTHLIHSLSRVGKSSLLALNLPLFCVSLLFFPGCSSLGDTTEAYRSDVSGISPFSIAAVADPQYAETPPRGKREPGEGVARLNHAVDNWNQRSLDWGVILGDLIDWDDIEYEAFPEETRASASIQWKHTRAILNAWERLDIPRYVVLGNHEYYVPDFDVDGTPKPASVLRAFGFEDRAYYNFRYNGFHFIALDGDLSPNNFARSTEEYQLAKAYYESFEGPQKKWWNAAISQKQISWLRNVLDESLSLHEPVVIMCHYPIHLPFDGDSLLNSEELLELLEAYPNVVLWLAGHDHRGSYTKMGARHHLTLKGMQNEADNWYQIDFTADNITVYQAEDVSTPKYQLKTHLYFNP